MGFDIDIGSIASSVINGIFGNKANHDNYKIWKEQQEWNKPINQLARLQEAGMNPNLVYGNGGISNTISSGPKMDAPKVDVGALFSYQQVKNGEKQGKLLDAQIQSENERRNYIRERTNAQRLDNDYKELENDYYRTTSSVKGGYPLVRALSQGYYWLKDKANFGGSQARDISLAEEYYNNRSNLTGRKVRSGDIYYLEYKNGSYVPDMKKDSKGNWRKINDSWSNYPEYYPPVVYKQLD